MRDILTDLQGWMEKGKPVALATVVQTWGSSPRGAGSKMGITSNGEIVGSVSGGCVENAVIEAGMQSLKTNQPRLLHFGVADETAWEVGLACGGSIDIFVKPLDQRFLEEVHSVIQNNRSAAIVTVVRGPDGIFGRECLAHADGSFSGGLGKELDMQVRHLAAQIFSGGVSQRVYLGEEVEVFIDLILPAPTLIAVGGVHITQALMSLAKTLGYQTMVIDPRKIWGSRDRFPQVDRLIQAWPDEAFEQLEITASTAIAMLTHDPKLDDPALRIALSSPAFYVGALGSKTTNEKRRKRLLEDGLREAQLSRLRAPIGLDIGARSPEEIALAIMAEVVEAHRKRGQNQAAFEAGLYPIRSHS
jgi:xanthine dehydrogenase accessory factor